MRAVLNSFLASLAFLTWFPATRLSGKSQRDISNSRAWFPLVGLLIGILLALVGIAAGNLFPVYFWGAVLLLLLAAVTRGLHADGLMDVCDGVFGGRTRERRLEIMKDSRVGAFGALGLGLVLLLKYGAFLSVFDYRTTGATGTFVYLSPLPDQGMELWGIILLLLFPMLSRWALVVSLAAFPYARDEGLGAPFHQGGIGLSTAFAGLFALAISVLVGGLGGLGLFLGATLLALILGWAMTRSLGGLTGDCYGAINELSEVAVLAAGLVLTRYDLLETLDQALQRF